jgi:hypothetical protein
MLFPSFSALAGHTQDVNSLFQLPISRQTHLRRFSYHKLPAGQEHGLVSLSRVL